MIATATRTFHADQEGVRRLHEVAYPLLPGHGVAGPPSTTATRPDTPRTPARLTAHWRATLVEHWGWQDRPRLPIPPDADHLHDPPPTLEAGLTKADAILLPAVGNARDLAFRAIGTTHLAHARDGVRHAVLLVPDHDLARRLHRPVHAYGAYVSTLAMLELTDLPFLPMMVIAIGAPDPPAAGTVSGASASRGASPS